MLGYTIWSENKSLTIITKGVRAFKVSAPAPSNQSFYWRRHVSNQTEKLQIIPKIDLIDGFTSARSVRNIDVHVTRRA